MIVDNKNQNIYTKTTPPNKPRGNFPYAPKTTKTAIFFWRWGGLRCLIDLIKLKHHIARELTMAKNQDSIRWHSNLSGLSRFCTRDRGKESAVVL